MSVKWELEWDKIYKELGEVQSDVLHTVKIAVDIFNQHNCYRIMDLGCGTGRHSIYLAQNGFDVYATDISETGLDITKSKADNLNLSNICYYQHDMRDIPFPDNYFDGILCVWTTGHGNYEDTKKNVNEIYRVLKDGGIVVIDYVSKEDDHYGKGIEIDKDTFINNVEGEENIPHHYSSSEELEELYKAFSKISINPIDYHFYDDENVQHTIKAFVMVTEK